MARRGYDPRYDYNQGYATGDMLLQLSQLLQQGIGNYQTLDLKNEAQQQKQSDYLLRLQDMLTKAEDRDLTRKVAEDTVAMNQATRTRQAQEAADKAAQAERQRGATGSFFTALTGMRPTQEPVTPPPENAQAISPQAQDRALAQFIYGRRRTTPLEASQTLGPSAQDLPTAIQEQILKSAMETEKPAAGFTLSPGQVHYGPSGEVVAEVPQKEPKPERFSRDLMDALRGQGIDPEQATPAQIAAARAQLQQEKVGVAAAGAGARAAAELPFEVYQRRLKESEGAVENMGAAQAIVNQIEALGKKIPVPDAWARVTGLPAREWGAWTQTNPDATEFRAKTGFLAQMARTFGERGVLTNQDVERVQQLLPLLNDIDEVKARKIAAIRDILASALQRAQQRLQTPVGTPSAPTQLPTPPGLNPTGGPAIDLNAVDAELRRRGVLK